MGRPRQGQLYGRLEPRRHRKIQGALRRRRRAALRSSRRRYWSVIHYNFSHLSALRERDQALHERDVAPVPRVLRYGNACLLGVNICSLRQRGALVALESRQHDGASLVALQRGVPVPACVVSMWTKGKRLPRLSSAMRSVGRRRALVFSYCPATERHAVIRLHRVVAVHGYVDDSRRAGGTQ